MLRNNFLQFVLAVLIIIFGMMLVLENLNLVTFNAGSFFRYIYPLLFILFGLKWMSDRVLRKGGSWLFGLSFFLVGILLVLGLLDVITFTFKDISKLWPLLIVYTGIMFLTHSRQIKKYWHDDYDNASGTHGYHSLFSVGSHEYKQPNWQVKPMHLSNWAGDFYLDFSKAFIPEEEIPITINALAGDIHILVPRNIEFRVFASVKAGEIDVVGQKKDGINRSLTYETIDYESAVQRLDFNLRLKAGSIRITDV